MDSRDELAVAVRVIGTQGRVTAVAGAERVAAVDELFQSEDGWTTTVTYPEAPDAEIDVGARAYLAIPPGARLSGIRKTAAGDRGGKDTAILPAADLRPAE